MAGLPGRVEQVDRARGGQGIRQDLLQGAALELLAQQGARLQQDAGVVEGGHLEGAAVVADEGAVPQVQLFEWKGLGQARLAEPGAESQTVVAGPDPPV